MRSYNGILKNSKSALQKRTVDALADLNDLRCVAAICEEKSLSGAARRLGINHATVFRRLNQLEEQLGVRLFERGGGRYVPTAAGEELARAGAAMEQTAEQSLLKVAGRDLQRYRRRGADATTRLLLTELRRWPLQGTSILDIGGGIGVIEMELADSGVGSATVVEASPAYFEVARREVASQSWKKYLLSRWVRKFFL